MSAPGAIDGDTKRSLPMSRSCALANIIADKASGSLVIDEKNGIDRAAWRKPRGIRLTPTSRYIRDKLFPRK